MKNPKLFLLASFAFGISLTSCEDSSKDPLQFDQLKKGSILALRGQAFDNLFNDAYLGGVDTIGKSADFFKETFDFEVDYLSEDQESIASVDVFAKYKSNGTRVKITSVSSSEFRLIKSYKRALISLKITDIIKATAVDFNTLPATNLEKGIISNFIIESDINLTSGEIVKASSVVNNSLPASDHFYPAHSLSLWVKK